MNRSFFRSSRHGLTLLELVVVLSILVVLAGLVVPNIGNLLSQSKAAGNAAVVNDVNRAVNSHLARTGSQPNSWDSLMSSTGGTTLSTKLHEQLTSSNIAQPQLQVTTLTANQAVSLTAAGITLLHDINDSVTNPSEAVVGDRTITTGTKLALLTKATSTGYGSTFLDFAFGINSTKTKWDNEFIVLGLSAQNTMRGSSMTDIPLIQSAAPYSHYARVLCVYMIPPGTGSTTFTATYVGCFLPDGTSLPRNLVDYNVTGAMDK